MILLSFAWVSLVLLAGLLIVDNGLCLLRNLRTARTSGLRYLVVPVYTYNKFFSLVVVPLLGLIERLALGPPASVTSWRWLVRGGWPWKLRYGPFEAMGVDTFMTVSPGGNLLFTADADVIRQIVARMSDFPKPTHLYRTVDIFGKNVVTTDGAAWRRHRRLVAPALGEKNNRLVWDETVRQMRALVARWEQRRLGETTAVRTLQTDAMLLSLNVIGKAGFGQEMGLPDEGGAKSEVQEQDEIIPLGHSVGFATALGTLVNNIVIVVALPLWIMRRGTKSIRNIYRSYVEFRQYMIEMLDQKRAALQSSPEASARSNMDLLGQIAKGQDLHLLEEADAKDPALKGGLTDSEVFGNLFVLLFAGHETTAGTLHNLIIQLAIHPWYQRRLQEALDAALGLTINAPRPLDATFNYDTALPKVITDPFMNAVVNETLRLMGPVPTVPKFVPAGSEPQTLLVDGVEVTIPPGTMIKLCASCVHRNPRYWPHRSSTRSGNVSAKSSSLPTTTATSTKRNVAPIIDESWGPSNLDNDIEAFRPDRWLTRIEGTTKDASFTSIISPPLGAYLPFSEGPRSCLGKRFALVELVAALSVLFSTHSVELDVAELTGETVSGYQDDDSEKITSVDDRERWARAAQEATRRWQHKSGMLITLQMRGSHVPVRLVRRGTERYDFADPHS